MCESENKKCNNSDARPTIGYLTPAVHDNYQQQWSGVVDAAQEFDANLLCFLGGALSNSWEFQAQANVIYDLVASENVDGLVSWASSIGNFVTDDEIRDFHERYHPLPIVTIGKAVEGFPGLMMENYDGMSEAIVHLIKVHGCRRLAFISGPKNHFQAQERYRAYVETLEAHGIPLDPNLVTPSLDWARSTGEKVMRVLLDERKLRPQTDFEAIVAANDGLLIGVLNVLQERGIHVPRDVAVVGFDNTAEGQTSASPLTSVRAPFYELGCQAVEKLLARIAGEQIPQETIVPSKLMIRRSCGCKSSAVTQAAAERSPQPEAMQVSREKFEAALAARREGILTGMVEAAGKLGGSLPPEWAGLLLDGFVAELKGEIADAFLTALDHILHQAVADDIAGDNIVVIQDAVSVLRSHLLPILDNQSLSQAENSWHQARVMIGEAVSLTQAHRAVLVRRQAAVLREVSQSLLTTFDLEGLTEGLAVGLPRMGIPGAYFSLYEDPKNPAGWSRLMLAYGPEGRAELGAGGVRFPSAQLVPEGMWPQGRRYSFVVKPLYFQDAQLGFILCEISSQESTIYETLGTQISNALQGALLVQRVRERSAELAREKYVLDTFIETVPDRIWFKDREGRFTRANRAHALNLGLEDPCEEIGKTDADFHGAEISKVQSSDEQEILRTGRPMLNKEVSSTRLDGGLRWALVTKMPLLDENGEIIGTFGISRDITELKSTQHEVELANKEIRALNERLKEENLRMSAELDVAQRIQEMILPTPEELQQIEGLDIVGYMQPAAEVGGDYYDVLNKNGVTYIGIGDVTGHGLESGVLMLMTQTAIRTLIDHGESDPIKFITTINRTLFNNVRRTGMDKSLTLALVNLKNGHLKLVGQHEEMLLVRADGQVERLDTLDLGFPLALEEEIERWVDQTIVELESGEGIVLYTDGITEAANDRDELYGLPRLCEVIGQNWRASAEGIKQAVVDDVTRHIGHQTVCDDLTLVVLKQP